jgi:hypothetical protein
MPKPRYDRFECRICQRPGSIDSGIGDLNVRETICYQCFHAKYPDYPNYYYETLGDQFKDLSSKPSIHIENKKWPKKKRVTETTTQIENKFSKSKIEKIKAIVITAALILPVIVIIILRLQLLYRTPVTTHVQGLASFNIVNEFTNIRYAATMNSPIYDVANQVIASPSKAGFYDDCCFGVKARQMNIPAIRGDRKANTSTQTIGPDDESDEDDTEK